MRSSEATIPLQPFRYQTLRRSSGRRYASVRRNFHFTGFLPTWCNRVTPQLGQTNASVRLFYSTLPFCNLLTYDCPHPGSFFYHFLWGLSAADLHKTSDAQWCLQSSTRNSNSGQWKDLSSTKCTDKLSFTTNTAHKQHIHPRHL